MTSLCRAFARILLRFAFVKCLKNRYLFAWEETVNLSTAMWEEGGRCSWLDMPYTPQHIANYFIDRAQHEGVPLSPMKLLKLVYIGYGWNLAIVGQRLFNERIEAWQFGPVVPSIYHEFKIYGSGGVSQNSIIVDVDEGDGGMRLSTKVPRIPDSDSPTNLILDRVWESYKAYSGWQLSLMTHEAGSPWHKVYREGAKGVTLIDEDIRAHYGERIKRYLDQAAKRKPAFNTPS